MNRSYLLVIGVVIVSIVLIVAAIVLSKPNSNSNGGGSADTFNVSITSSFSFSPSSITIHVGQNITWTNDASVTHTVTSDTGSAETFSSGDLGQGQKFTHQFNQVGTFTYHCSIHTYMTGTIVVTAS